MTVCTSTTPLLLIPTTSTRKILRSRKTAESVKHTAWTDGQCDSNFLFISPYYCLFVLVFTEVSLMCACVVRAFDLCSDPTTDGTRSKKNKTRTNRHERYVSLRARSCVCAGASSGAVGIQSYSRDTGSDQRFGPCTTTSFLFIFGPYWDS